MAAVFGSLWLAQPAHALDVVLRLVPTCRVCTAGRDIGIHWSLTTPDGAPVVVGASLLELTDESGNRVFTVENPFSLQPGERLPQGNVSGNVVGDALRKELAKLEAGEYRARWLTEGRSSNTARFTVTSDPGDVAPLTIEPLLLESGDAGDAELVAYFVNTGGETIELAGTWGASRVLIDGVPYTRAMTTWCGTSSLGPGGSWGVVVDLDSYCCRLNRPAAIR